MRSLVAKLLTGLWIADWRRAYTLAQYHARQAADHSGFAGMVPAIHMTPDEWITAVIQEAKARQEISHAIAGRRPLLRTAIRQVIDEVTRPGKPVEVPNRA